MKASERQSRVSGGLCTVFCPASWLPAADCLSCREEGHKVSVRVTYEGDCTERLVQEAVDRGDVDTIIAAGGDGSINQVSF